MYMQKDAIQLYADGLTIRAIAAQTGVSVHRTRKALIAARTVFRGARGRKPARDAILESYRETQSCAETAKALGIHPDTVNKHAKEAGILRAPGGIRRYAFNEAFFDSYTVVSCYWAGFLAADGCLVDNKHGARIIQIMLARKDRAHLESFARSAASEHPVKDLECAGVPESIFTLSSREWWCALHERFNLTQRKSMTLQPPPEALGEEMTWHYVRGYFDGDGSVRAPLDSKGRVKQIEFVSGSRAFIEWLRRFMESHHKIEAHKNVWRLCLSGAVMRRTVPLMYAHSTPDTRLARKYERLKHLLT